MRNNTRLWSGMIAGGMLIFTAACNETRDTGSVTTRTDDGTSTTPTAEAVEERDNALVRVVNAMPGGAASIYAGDSLAFGTVAYKSVTEFKEMPDDYFGFKAVKPGASAETDAIAENREKLSNGGHYTIIALPDDDADQDSNGELRVLDDELKPLTEGKARIRFVHAIPNVEEVSVFARGNDEAIVDGVNYKMEAGWDEIDPMSGTLEIRTEDRRTALATIPSVNLEAGKSYTYVLAGRQGKVDVIKFVDDVQQSPDVDDGVNDSLRDTVGNAGGSY